MHWTKFGELYDREHHARGVRGEYKIDIDMPADRWAIFLNGVRIVEDVYCVTNAERIAEVFDLTGTAELPVGLRPRPDGRIPRFVETSRAMQTAMCQHEIDR